MSPMPDDYPPLNYCVCCGLDFASVAAFDRHRVGVHAYTFQEGLRLEPPREDGRRCLDPEEMIAYGLVRDPRGRWSIAADAERARRHFSATWNAQERQGAVVEGCLGGKPQ
jgi:hypothetical protein